MARFELGEKFRLVIIPFRPLQHLLEVQQHMDCLDCVRKHLARRAADSGRVPDGCRTDARSGAHARDIGDGVRNTDGRQVRITERVAGFHRAEQRMM